MGQKRPHEGSVANFAQNSRLAFLGTWKTRLRRMLQGDTTPFSDPLLSAALREAEAAVGGGCPAGPKLPIYMHLDMDCFFVAVARRMDPTLEGPVAVVTGLDDWSEVCTASHEARPYGLRKGMWVHEARRLLPAVRMVCTTPALFTRLDTATRLLYKVAEQYTPELHPISCDELLLRTNAPLPTPGPDGVHRGPAMEVARALADAVLRHTGCSVSIGLGVTAYAARYATSLAKPPGPGAAFSTLEGVRSAGLRDLSGIGRRTADKLATLVAARCPPLGTPPKVLIGDLACLSPKDLTAACGAGVARTIQSILSGEPFDEGLVFGLQRFFAVSKKTISRELNWCVRPESTACVRRIISDLAAQVDAERQAVPVRRVSIRLLVRQPGAPPPRKRGGYGSCDRWCSEAVQVQRITPTVEAAAFAAFLTYPKQGEVDQVRGVGVHATLATGQPETTRSVLDFFRKENPCQESPERIDVASSQDTDSTSTDGVIAPLPTPPPEEGVLFDSTSEDEESAGVVVNAPELITPTQFFLEGDSWERQEVDRASVNTRASEDSPE